MKDKIELKVRTLIKCGKYTISVGFQSTSNIAIISNKTDFFVQFKNIKKGGKLAKIKRKFNNRLCSSEAFFFAYMTEEETFELINMLKK